MATDRKPQNRQLKVLMMCAVDFTAWHFLRPLALRLMAEGFDVTVACGGGRYIPKLRELGIRHLENPIARSMNPFKHLAEIARTYRLIRQGDFDIVHVHTPIAALVGRISAWLARVPVKIYTAHGFYFHERMSPLKRTFHVALEKVGAYFGDFIMTVSAEDEKAAIELGIARPGEIETILNGVDVEHFSPDTVSAEMCREVREELGLTEDAIVVGFVGRLVREKGILELVRAMAKLSKEDARVRLLVVGDVLTSDYDAGKEAFLKEAQELGISERICYAGMVDDTRPYLAVMDVFCLPSYREGMPVSLLEAMAMERPCVATNIRGCREEIIDGVSGLLVPPGDADALAAVISQLIREPALARKLASAARQRVIEHFDIQKVLAHQVSIYRRLLVKKGVQQEALTQ
ncbi:MAG: glycosyltransferase family 4 protein [Candidatus Sumerlaeaceae bacterium]|nr:glycosyltransferase family 4 protein [Candidatus Sumerlaeaceae bacterium]